MRDLDDGLCADAFAELLVAPQVKLGWENGKLEEAYFVAGYHPDGSVEIQVRMVFRV